MFTKEQLQWLDDLESGKFEQGKCYLHVYSDGNDDKFCCLGVACFRFSSIKPSKSGGVAFYDSGCHYPTEEAVKILHLKDRVGTFRNEAKIDAMHAGTMIINALTEMNDSGFTFKEIAKYIRENPENVFTNF